MSIHPGYWLIYGAVALIALGLGATSLAEGYGGRNSYTEAGRADRVNGARLLLAAPIWPLVLAGLIAFYVPYGTYRLARLALNKED